MEIVLIPKKNIPSQYPGVYLFTGPTRMMRPVKNLSINKTELIGTFEQIYLNICVTADEAHEGVRKFLIEYIKYKVYLICIYT
jgi:DNA-directed RNA polymerase I subunit RPA2